MLIYTPEIEVSPVTRVRMIAEHGASLSPVMGAGDGPRLPQPGPDARAACVEGAQGRTSIVQSVTTAYAASWAAAADAGSAPDREGASMRNHAT